MFSSSGFVPGNSRIEGRGGSWRWAVVLLGGHTPSKNLRRFCEYKHTSLHHPRRQLYSSSASSIANAAASPIPGITWL